MGCGASSEGVNSPSMGVLASDEGSMQPGKSEKDNAEMSTDEQSIRRTTSVYTSPMDPSRARVYERLAKMNQEFEQTSSSTSDSPPDWNSFVEETLQLAAEDRVPLILYACTRSEAIGKVFASLMCASLLQGAYVVRRECVGIMRVDERGTDDSGVYINGFWMFSSADIPEVFRESGDFPDFEWNPLRWDDETQRPLISRLLSNRSLFDEEGSRIIVTKVLGRL